MDHEKFACAHKARAAANERGWRLRDIFNDEKGRALARTAMVALSKRRKTTCHQMFNVTASERTLTDGRAADHGRDVDETASLTNRAFWLSHECG